MMALRFVRHTFGISSMAAMLAGCGQSAVPTVSSQAPATATARMRGALLYVAHVGTIGSRKDVGIAIFTFPQIKRAGNIDLQYGWTRGMCSDASGNVWVLAGDSGGSYAVEFAHGATKPIERIKVRGGLSSNGCAIDPSSGDLAVMNTHRTYEGSVQVWHAPRAGLG